MTELWETTFAEKQMWRSEPSRSAVFARDCFARMGATEILLRRWKRLDLGARAVPRNSQLIERLKVQPELGTVPEEVTEPQGCLAGDGSLPLDDRGHAVRRHRRIVVYRLGYGGPRYSIQTTEAC